MKQFSTQLLPAYLLRAECNTTV